MSADIDPPDDVDVESYRRGYAAALGDIGAAAAALQFALAVGGGEPPPSPDDDHPDDGPPRDCPECGTELTPHLGGRTCRSCEYSDEKPHPYD